MNLIIVFNISMVCRNVQHTYIHVHIHTCTYCTNRARKCSAGLDIFKIKHNANRRSPACDKYDLPRVMSDKRGRHLQPSRVENGNRNGFLNTGKHETVELVRHLEKKDLGCEIKDRKQATRSLLLLLLFLLLLVFGSKYFDILYVNLCEL